MKSPSDSKPVSPPVAIVTGGSAGLGLETAAALLHSNYRVAIIGRDDERLNAAVQSLQQSNPNADVIPIRADVSSEDAAHESVKTVIDRWQRLDLLVNNIGQSDRGWVLDMTPEHLMQRVAANIVPTLCMSRAAHPYLRDSRGVVINVGSLAAKVGARFLGAYPTSKHALAGLTQQMRLEWKPDGIHVGLINPGPIRRDDAGQRYNAQVDSNLPEQAKLAGGGTNVKGVDPKWVAKAIVTMAERRQPDRILPRYLRVLVAIGHLWPPLGDWLLLKFTSVKR